jgi:hypothetical protein
VDARGWKIDVPAQWARREHSAASRLAHGAAYATHVGCWHTRLRVIEGEDGIRRFKDAATGATRSFCALRIAGNVEATQLAAARSFVEEMAGLLRDVAS